MERRLSAIMVTDVVGFSRLMRANEIATLQALKSHLEDVVEGQVAEHAGRVVKSTGDGFIAEFPSVVNAATCGAEIQSRMRNRNLDVPIDRRIEFRIGINVGDIIHDGDDVFGDGVNIAARIESLARPGGIAVSGPTRSQISRDSGLRFEDGGEHVLKNIDQPLQVFHLASSGAQELPADAPLQRNKSVAVLPLINLSEDREQDYFADGITEDLIVDLSKISTLFVVGRNAVFGYKGKLGNSSRIARELGVRYLLEGSVRRAGKRVRVTAQLIDGTTGRHVWADRYDRDLEDIFEVQDEITRTIVDQLRIKLNVSDERSIATAPTRDVDAYSYYLKGRHFYHLRMHDYMARARAMFEEAVKLDPTFARAYAGIADCDSWSTSWLGAAIDRDAILASAEKAIELEPNLAEAHAAKGQALLAAGQDSAARASMEHALSIDPLCYEAHYYYARYCWTSGETEQAKHHFIRALEIRPDDYRSPLLLNMILTRLGEKATGRDYVDLGLQRAKIAADLYPDNPDPLELGASTLAQRGEFDSAREWLDRALRIRGGSDGGSFNIACVYSLLGETDLALDVLERIVEDAGPDVRQWLSVDPDLESIRDDPRFKELMKLD
ncbi:TPR end-of-group domain-containing protein [Ruegeria arenilitoris]|uniref:TPR end-of-group domain-containing protein n=1 Tax=Ruegeria arenilitoris TaxID=1173585 RepID=UPI001C2BCE9B